MAKLNVQLLRKIQEQIVSQPKNFYMSNWASPSDCGTACCIGGWAVALDRGIANAHEICSLIEKDDYLIVRNQAKDDVPKLPTQTLGLTPSQANRLFYVENWPVRFRDSFHGTSYKNLPARAEVAHARIEFFIQTNGSDRVRKPKPATVAIEALIQSSKEKVHATV